MKLKRMRAAEIAKNLSVKEYSEADFADLANLLWTNIGLKTSLSPLRTLLLTNVTQEGEYARLNAHLAEQIVKMKKSLLFIDLDRGASALKKKLSTEPALGVTDFFYKLYEEPFFSTNAEDYGFWDLIILSFLKKRTGRLVLISEEADPVQIELYQGYPTDVLTASKSMRQSFEEFYCGTPFTSEQRAQLFDAFLFKTLTELASQHYFSFSFQEQEVTTSQEIEIHSVTSPHFLKAPITDSGYISHSLRQCSDMVLPGIRFMIPGQFRIKAEEFAKRNQQILPLLQQKFDFILFNAPAVSIGQIAKEVAKVVDGTVLVLKSGAVECRYFKNVLSAFQKEKINVIGTILTEVDPPYQNIF